MIPPYTITKKHCSHPVITCSSIALKLFPSVNKKPNTDLIRQRMDLKARPTVGHIPSKGRDMKAARTIKARWIVPFCFYHPCRDPNITWQSTLTVGSAPCGLCRQLQGLGNKPCLPLVLSMPGTIPPRHKARRGIETNTLSLILTAD